MFYLCSKFTELFRHGATTRHLFSQLSTEPLIYKVSLFLVASFNPTRMDTTLQSQMEDSKMPQLFTGIQLTKQSKCLCSHYLILFIVDNNSNLSHVQTSKVISCVFFQIFANAIKHHTSNESIAIGPHITPAWYLLV